MYEEDGGAGCATKSGEGYFYAKLLARRVNICMAIRASVVFAEDARA